MKISFLNMLYSKGKEEGGGLVTYLENISKAMADLGHDVTVVTSGPKNGMYYQGNVRVAQVGDVETLSIGSDDGGRPLFRG